MGIKYKYSGPKLRGMAKAVKAATEKGFQNHRSKFLPRHFSSSAPRKYFPAYSKVGGTQVKDPGSWKRRYARMSPQEKAEFHKSMNDKKRRAKKNTNKSPLVDSGILQQAATSGALKVTGPADRRKMKIPAPHYFNFHKPGQIHKKSALEAVVPQEEREFAKVVDKEIDQFLKGKS